MLLAIGLPGSTPDNDHGQGYEHKKSLSGGFDHHLKKLCDPARFCRVSERPTSREIVDLPADGEVKRGRVASATSTRLCLTSVAIRSSSMSNVAELNGWITVAALEVVKQL